MGILYIENENVKLGINQIGGSLVSFVNKQTGEELLWQGNACYWPNQDVVIFPIVGLRREGFVHENKKYHIGTMHGFAREKEFAIVDKKDGYIHIEIAASKETLEIYPFNFKFGLKYQLLEKGFKLTYVVASQDGKEMPFYVGGHAALNMHGGEDKVVFECEKNNFYYYPQRNGPASDEVELVYKNATEIILQRKDFTPKTADCADVDFSKGCMLERNFGGGCTLVRSDGTKFAYDIADCSVLTLWGYQNGGDYFCIEPWWGIKQTESMEQDLSKCPKINIVTDKPKEFYFSIEILD